MFTPTGSDWINFAFMMEWQYIFVMIVGILLCGLHAWFAASRYRQMEKMTEEIEAILHGREKLNVRKMGKRNALLFTCSVVQGAMFEGDQELKFWFSDDGYYVPLGVMAPLRVGACWCWLKQYKP